MARVKYTVEDKQLMRVVGDNIKYYRINNNCPDNITDKYGRVSQEKLAELSDTSTSMISSIEAEHVDAPISIPFLRKISEALNIPIYAFFLKRPINNPPEDPFAEK